MCRCAEAASNRESFAVWPCWLSQKWPDEVDEVLSLATLRASGTKRIAQKIKLLLSIPFPSIIILAIDNFRLFRMKLQPTFLHPPGNRCPHFLRRWGKPDSD